MQHDLDLDSLDPKIREKMEEMNEIVDSNDLRSEMEHKLQELVLLSNEELFDKFNKYCGYDAAFQKTSQSIIAAKGEALMKSDIARLVMMYEEKEKFGIMPIN